MQPFLGANPGHVALFPDSPPPPFACPQAQGERAGGFLFHPQSGQEAGAFGLAASQPPPESLSLRKSAIELREAEKDRGQKLVANGVCYLVRSASARRFEIGMVRPQQAHNGLEREAKPTLRYILPGKVGIDLCS